MIGTEKVLGSQTNTDEQKDHFCENSCIYFLENKLVYGSIYNIEWGFFLKPIKGGQKIS